IIETACEKLIQEKYSPETPAALVYKASWPDEKILRGTLETLPKLAKEAGIYKTALILVGDFLNKDFNTKSKLYDKNFSHEFRK
ncbi:MAG: cobalt-precorrin-4 C(11)-methyltransferase, partial [Synergistaceae bacterium]|nr:cobalt-precorrin-4 C(11)-methyltransferase [Synergistaceae bacterium]